MTTTVTTTVTTTTVTTVMTEGTAGTARPREIWTRLTVDPLADPLARRLARLPGVRPDRVTGLALALGLGAAACFAVGALRAGGALFLLRFFVDCLDGKVARLQGSTTERGAFLDLAADVAGVTLGAGALGWHLLTTGRAPAGLVVGLLAAVAVYGWALDHRKHLAARAGLGTGGHDHTAQPRLPGTRRWVALCRRLGMSPVPWAVEAEVLALGLVPLLAPAWAAGGLAVALAFYVVADAVNLRRSWRLAAALDRAPREVAA